MPKRIWTAIPGLPKGWGVVRVELPSSGDWILGPEGPEQATSEHSKIGYPMVILIDARNWMIAPSNTPDLLPIKGKFRNGRQDEWTEGTIVRYNGFATHKWLAENGMWYKRLMLEVEDWQERKKC